jgi:16S rRNA (adenine1518-N6/adenine1519-N6)-dimethyltransferase
MYAKKSLGQHFLTSQGALVKIIDAGHLKKTDTVLEIGPGRGVLTEKLLEQVKKVIAVEKDDALVELLQEKFKKEMRSKKLELVHADILDYEPTGEYKLIANIPYNITGAILEKFLSAGHQPELAVLLVQKEVAERIVAKDNKESILSLSIKAYGVPKYIQTVKAGSFSPAPSVDSAIIAIENISKEFFASFSEKDFFVMLRAGFKSKRKKLSSNLATIIEKEKVLNTFKKLNLDENLRAEDVNILGWKTLAENLL